MFTKILLVHSQETPTIYALAQKYLKFILNTLITKTFLFKYTENFTSKNEKKNQVRNSDIFHISAQNIDCGYMLEAVLMITHNQCF